MTWCIEDGWEVVGRYLDAGYLLRHQIESYNDFYLYGISRILEEFSIVPISNKTGPYATIILHRIYIGRPSAETDDTEKVLFPSEARMRNLTYAAPLYLDAVVRYENGKEDTYAKMYVGKLPIMVRSIGCSLYQQEHNPKCFTKECPRDGGGYFIANGIERILVSTENMATRQVYVFEKKGVAVAELRTFTNVFTLEYQPRNHNIATAFTSLRSPIPLAVLLWALGATPKVVQMEDEIVTYLYEDSATIPSVEHAQEIIGNILVLSGTKLNKTQAAVAFLNKELFPHLSRDKRTVTLAEKAQYLGFMVNKLIRTLRHQRPFDDRDHFANKRLDTTGSLMSTLFRRLIRKLVKDLTLAAGKVAESKREINLPNLLKLGSLSKGLITPIRTGNWGMQKQTSTKTGISQALNRLTYAAFLSHMRRVVSPNSKEGKLEKLRQLHGSQWGFIDPAESPEGASLGIVKNLALLSTISIGAVEATLEPTITPFLIKRCPEHPIVLVNGVLMGSTTQPDELMQEIRRLRRCGQISAEVSVAFFPTEQEVRIASDAGRILRPVLVVRNGKLTIHQRDRACSWANLLDRGKVEFIDAMEQDCCLIAATPQEITPLHTHCEIHPSVILGAVSSTIPFAHHNQAPRNAYQAAMSKQSLGVYISNYMQRMEVAHVLCYPQKPLCSTRPEYLLGYQDLPSGANPIVAVACMGYNQEDSIILNKNSIERGLFWSISYRTFQCEEDMRNRIERPDPMSCQNMRVANYEKLDDEGIIAPGTPIADDDVLVGRVELSKEKDGESKRDTSLIFKSDEPGYVDSVILTTNESGHKMVRIRVHNVRRPELGDKFAMRCAQKGTTGMIYDQEDLPFTAQGMTPDLIINSHALPSRMTIAMLIECLHSKAGALGGHFRDASTFQPATPEEAEQELRAHGYEAFGNEHLYCGVTGRMLQGSIFMGPIHYQRLKHMVVDKIHSRSTGYVQALCRQPVNFLAGVQSKICAGPSQRARPPFSGNTLKLLVPSHIGNGAVALGKTQRYDYNLVDWAILSGILRANWMCLGMSCNDYTEVGVRRSILL